MTVREFILAYLARETEATSYDVLDASGFSGSQVDAQLKVLTEEGVLVRDKKSTNGGRPVYHYKLANPNVTTVAINGTKTTDEQAGVEVEDEPTGPKTIYLVRKNDQHPNVWHRRQMDYARALAPFDAFHSRTWATFGNTVTSLFVSEDSIGEIAAVLQEALPELTFGIATTLDEAVTIITNYTGGSFDEAYFRSYSERYFSHFQSRLNTQARATVTATPAQAPAPAQRSTYAIMHDLANGITLSEEEAVLAVRALAQDWLENN